MPGGKADLLRVLRDEEDQGEVVQAQREIKELVRIAEEDDILDRLLCPLRIASCRPIAPASVLLLPRPDRSQRTFEIYENPERRLVITRLLPNVCREDRVGVMENVPRLELLAHEVAHRVDLLARVTFSPRHPNPISSILEW